LTTRLDRLDSSKAPVTLRGKKHKAMAGQLTTVSKRRLQNRLGRLSQIEMRGVEQTIKVQPELK
jgi:mRNA interferase MazF